MIRNGRRFGAIALLVSALLSFSAATATRASASTGPTISVSPSYGLAAGSVVDVRLSGLPSNVDVRFVQCDRLYLPADPEDVPYCPDLTSAQTTPAGTLTLPVTLEDPVSLIEPYGDPDPIYCRADTCRLYAVWTTTSGAERAISHALSFLGSPATIALSQAAGLRDGQHVHAYGTAIGASGQTVRLVEEACFSIIQGSGCYGTVRLGATTVAPNGTWQRTVRVHRYLADGTDCADPDILGACEVSAVVLTPSGEPDDTFGVARRGQPAAWISLTGGQ